MNEQYPTRQPHPDPLVEALINLPGASWHEGYYRYEGMIADLVAAIREAVS